MVIHIEILNWQKYNPRKDVKSASWFRVDNTIYLSQVWDLDAEVLKLWLLLLAICSQKNPENGSFSVPLSFLQKMTNGSAEGNLEILQQLHYVRTSTRVRSDVDTSTFRRVCSTDERTDGTDGHTNTNGRGNEPPPPPPTATNDEPESVDPVNALAHHWNLVRNPAHQKKVSVVSEHRRNQVLESMRSSGEGIEFWISVLDKAANTVLTFPDGVWAPSFDWCFQGSQRHGPHYVRLVEGAFDRQSGATSLEEIMMRRSAKEE